MLEIFLLYWVVPSCLIAAIYIFLVERDGATLDANATMAITLLGVFWPIGLIFLIAGGISYLIANHRK